MIGARALLAYSLALGSYAALAQSGNAPASPYDPTSDLMTFFGNKCPSIQSPLTTAALVQSDALKSIIESIRDDSACAGIKSALSQIDRLSRSDIMKVTEVEVEREKIKTQSYDLELAINAEKKRGEAADADFISDLQSQLAVNKTQLALSSSKADDVRAEQRVAAIGDLQKFSLAALTQIEQSDACAREKPALPAQLGAQLFSLSGSFAGGIMGAVMSTTGEFIDRFLTYIRRRGPNQAIATITNTTQGYGIGCAVEAMARTACDTRDLEILVNQRIDGIKAPPPMLAASQNGFQANNILVRDQAAFSNWLSRSSTGSVPQDTAAAARYTAALSMKTNMTNLQISQLASFAEAQRRLQRENGDPVASSRRQMQQLASIIESYSDLYEELYSADKTCGLLLALYTGGTERVANCGDVSCQECIETKMGKRPPVGDALRSSIEKFTGELVSRASAKASLEMTSDPGVMLDEFEARGVGGARPLDFVQGMKEFVDFLLTQDQFVGGTRRRRAQLVELQGRLQKALDAADGVAPNGAELTSDAAVRAIRIALSGQRESDQGQVSGVENLNYIPETIQRINVAWLQHAAETGRLTPEVATLMSTAPSDSLGTMLQAYTELEISRSTINVAKGITKSNMLALNQIFESQMESTLELMTRDANGSGNYADRNLMCMRLALLPRSTSRTNDVDDTNDQFNRRFNKFCRPNGKGVTYHSAIDPNLKLDYDELMGVPGDRNKPGMPWDSLKGADRVCALQDFFRKARIKEQLQNRPGPRNHRSTTRPSQR